mmetsp:Transcript_67293/g.173264  ORF Transcript_67293/g.173264 Transcript_67293/m.173264 type:complete len:192 (+) Transcript_67293:91-666(+)
MAAAAAAGASARVLDFLCEGLPCTICQDQPIEHRLRMEMALIGSVRDLHRMLDSSLPLDERLFVDQELVNAERVLAELAHHRAHTPFFKVVARGATDFFSVFDGRTKYIPGVTSSPEGGCFVHASTEEATRSIASFPRSSAAWGAPRALLLVRGEGDVHLRHGKVHFNAITPLCEVPWAGGEAAPKCRWRR